MYQDFFLSFFARSGRMQILLRPIVIDHILYYCKYRYGVKVEQASLGIRVDFQKYRKYPKNSRDICSIT